MGEDDVFLNKSSSNLAGHSGSGVFRESGSKVKSNISQRDHVLVSRHTLLVMSPLHRTGTST